MMLPFIRNTLIIALLTLLCLGGYGLVLKRQYQDARKLVEHATPLVNDLLGVKHNVLLRNTEQALWIEGDIQNLSHSLAAFKVYLATRSQQENPDLLLLISTLDNYLLELGQLQDADLRLGAAWKLFRQQIEQLDSLSPELSVRIRQLSEHSERFRWMGHPAFVAYLDDLAAALTSSDDARLSDMLYAHKLFRQSLRRLFALRQQLAAIDVSGMRRWHMRWEAEHNHTKECLLLVLALVLGVFFSTGMALLHARNTQLRQSNRTAVALARAKTDFLANMSHEIRTPMNAIIGFNSLLQQTPLNAQQADYIKKIRTSSDNLLLLINDILDLTKVELGKLELEDISFCLNQQLDSLTNLFADMSEQKQLEVIINKAPDVPDQLQGDPLRLGQVLVNLVSNAVKFTERGEVVLSIYLSGEDRRQLCFEVKDTGIGIMPGKVASLFQPFTQLDASITRKYGGSGLGLNISHHLVQLMQGTISVQSQPGLGSVFKVTLPLREAKSSPQEADRPVFVPGQKILLVDDNELVLEIMERILREAGFVIYTARDIGSARDILRQQGAGLRLAVIDCRLGQDNGLELAGFIASQHHLAGMELVITSAFGREQPSAQMDKLGIRHFLSKPMTEKSLLNCLSRALAPRSEQAVTAAPDKADDAGYYRERLAGSHLLLAEDNRINQQLVVEFLARVGVTVTLASHGQQAVEMVSKTAFDAILMDIQMPILDGLQATRQIRKLRVNHGIPIIALTASAMRGDQETSLEAGMNGYVTKPVNPAELYQALLQVGIGQPQATPETKETAPAQDYLALDQVRERFGHDGAAFALLLRLFLEEHQDDIWQLQAALANGDGVEVGQVLRRLAAVSVNIHALPLAELAGAMASQGHAGARLEPGKVEELIRVFAKTREQADKLLSRPIWSA